MLIVVFAQPALTTQAEPKVYDRLLIEVNQEGYSQLEAESYLAIKHALEKSASSIARPSSDNWQEYLREFEVDMLISHESARLSSFRATPAMIEKSKSVIEDKRRSSSELSQWLEYLELTADDIDEFLKSALRIESFKRSKLRQMKASGGATDTIESDWQQELRQRFFVRVFDGARVYSSITK